ncbi:restriction endonuclease [Phascolarctobacterium sp.]|uniref:restriction endonuclease n=1 Tax=Phascolarctobacterium sp. TaxID=2049039 RepID=UPI00386F8F9C
MRKNIDLSADEYREIVDNFYNYFEDGYKFEEFLKVYLERIGLEEVFVTKKSGDGGIDLTAVRKGIGGLSNSVDELFYIQAKRYSPETTISPEKIRALRGSFRSGVGMFITTGKVSDNAKVEAQKVDPSRPIIVVDGRELVGSCIEKEIGFTFKPVFSKTALDSVMKKTSATVSDQEVTVERIVTENDIRAYILVLPRAIKERISDDTAVITIRFGDSSYKEYRIDAQRRYVGGISKAYRDFGLRQPDGVFVSKRAVWHIEAVDKFTVEFKEL